MLLRWNIFAFADRYHFLGPLFRQKISKLEHIKYISLNTNRFPEVQITLQSLCDTVHLTVALAGVKDPSANIILRHSTLERASTLEEVLNGHRSMRLRLMDNRGFIRNFLDRDGGMDASLFNGCERKLVKQKMEQKNRYHSLSFSIIGCMT